MSDYLRCAPDLAQWFGLDEVYACWGRKAAGGEKNPAALFIDVRNTGATGCWRNAASCGRTPCTRAKWSRCTATTTPAACCGATAHS